MMESLARAIEGLNDHGFTAHFGVVGNRLRAFERGKPFGSQEVVVRDYLRFEGVSTPRTRRPAGRTLEGRCLRREEVATTDVMLAALASSRARPWVGEKALTMEVPTMSEEWRARPDRPVVGALLHVRLAEEIDRLKREATWHTSKHNAITLTKESALRAVLVVLGAAHRIREHQASGPFTLQVVSGRLRFHAAGEALELASGEVVALDSTQAHEVEAVEDSAFLLTLAQAS